jgi:predicted nucleotide-binding protein
MNKAKAIETLRGLREQIQHITSFNTHSPIFMKWRRDVDAAIRHVFPNNPKYAQEYENISYKSNSWAIEEDEAFSQGLSIAGDLLESMVEEIEKYWDESQESPVRVDLSIRPGNPKASRIFIIHGSDEAVKEKVARILQNLGIEPIILHEQANAGRTLIEKFESHSNVDFAVALLTSDDVGAAKQNRDNLQPRARQNVIMELGYFLGKIGRQRVCALYSEGVEIPSDYKGVAYIPLSGQWKIDLGKELKQAGFPVDFNKLT